MPDAWWTVFDDAELDSAVARALQDNFTLQSARQRLLAAQAVVDRATAPLFPDLDAFLDGSVQRPENPAGEPLQLGLASQYELDFWGRLRSQVDAVRYRAEASRADLQTAALSVSAEVVRTWFRLVETQNELDLLTRQIETNDKVLRSLQTRFGSGQIRSVDILRQQQLLEATRAQRMRVESRLQVLRHQLAVLLGQPPQTRFELTPHTLPELPPLPETGLPLDLVQRRPDVQRAYSNLLAADRDLAAAISNQYPRLTFSASLTSAGDTADDLFQDWVRSFAGNLLAPIFYGGRLRAEVDRTEAVKNQRLYDYGQSTLTAFREVEDALIREEKQTARLASLRRQLDLAQQTYNRLRNEYFNGVGNFLDVLTALTDEQQLRRDVLAGQLELLEYRVALYRALAGGISPEMDEDS